MIAPGDRALIPTGFAFAIPDGFEAQVRPRSGLALRHGIVLPNAPGTIDSDYRGEVSTTEDGVTCQYWSRLWLHTHDKTVSLLKAAGNYGLKDEQIHFIKQACPTPNPDPDPNPNPNPNPNSNLTLPLPLPLTSQTCPP